MLCPFTSGHQRAGGGGNSGVNRWWGLRFPNEERQMVRLSEVIASSLYDKSKSPLTMALATIFPPADDCRPRQNAAPVGGGYYRLG